MSICKEQLRSFITRTLRKIPQFYSEEAIELMMFTAAVESDLGHYPFKQNGGGPARGIWQVELDTMRDNYGNFLYFRDRLKEDIRLACGVDKYDEEALEYNIAFNLFMARLKYWRVPEPLPTTPKGMAQYHEEFYNAHDGNYASTGKEDWEVALQKYSHFVG